LSTFRWVVTAVVAAAVLAAPAADARPYRSPGYKGTRSAPATLPVQPPAALSLGDGGIRPQVLVDDAGTAHIVWSEPQVDTADVTRYCRVKRGAGACDVVHALIPDQSSAGGDHSRYNDETSGPRVLVVGDQVVVLTFRYPNVIATPSGGTSDRNTYLFASSDGGTTFGPEALVGRGELSGEPVVFGTPDAPRIGLISDTQTGGPFVQAISAGRYESARADLGDQGYSSSLARFGGTSVIAAFHELDGRTRVRAWNGQGDVHDAANWSEQVLPGEDPRLAGGPAGIFLVNREGNDLRVRSIGADGGVGEAQTVQASQGTSRADFFQDGSGKLGLAVRRTTEAGDTELVLRSSTDGVRWSPGQVLQRVPFAEGLNSTDIAATSDGGGFAVSHVGNGGRPGRILATALGRQAATGLPGLGGLAGGGGDPSVVETCQRIKFGSASVLSEEGCLLGVAGQANVKVSEGILRLNGLEIVPDAGVKIMLNARERSINTTGKVTVQLRAPGIEPIVLWHEELHINLKAERKTAAQFKTAQAGDGGCQGQLLANFNQAVDVKGFPVRGGVRVYMGADSSCIPVSLELPKAFGGIRGNAVLRADNARGLQLDTLHFEVNQAFLGPLLVEELLVDYRAAGDEWRGKVNLGLPPQPGGPKLGAAVVFQGGAFKEGSFTITPLPWPGIGLDPFATSYLTRFFGSFALEPVKIGGGVDFGILPVPPDQYTFTITGEMDVTFADPVKLHVTGRGALFGFPIASEELTLTSDGFVRANGHLELDLDVVSASGMVEAFVDASSKQWGGKASGEVCIGDVICPGGKAVVSTIGVGACQEVLVPYGFGYRWGASIDEIETFFGSCDLSGYEVKPPPAKVRTAQGGGAAAFTVPAGERLTSLRLTGAGGSPRVVLVSPSGERIAPSGDLNAAGAPAYASSPGTGPETFVAIPRPAAGNWIAEPEPGSPAVTAIAQARELPQPRVSARVRGRGRTRTLAYTATRRAGLSVTFLEAGPNGTRRIGTTERARGTLRFTPADGLGRRRTITAVITQGGIPREERSVGSYTAPPDARPGPVAGLSVRRRGRTLTARWRRLATAHAYSVRIDLPDGRRLLRLLPARTTTLRIGVPRSGRIGVSVTARNRGGRVGKAARVTLRR
jgi:hypothetical protein